MYQGYLFPMNIEINESNIPKAILVNTSYDDAALQRASDRKRLCCIGCLGQAHVVRIPAVNGPVSHFAHSVYADPNCIFRVNWSYPPDENQSPVSHKGEDPGKMVERLLLRALQHNLEGRPNTAIRSIPQRLPMIEIDGLAQPVEILSLAPGDADSWVPPFSGMRADRQTIFFIASWDIRSDSLKTVFSMLMSKRPCIVISPARPERPESLFTLTSEQPTGNLCWHPLEEVDIGWIDYQRLLGVAAGGSILFLRKPYRIALERLEAAIEAEPEGSPLRILFHLMAKILLVDGAAIHRSVFDEDFENARKPYQACRVFPTSDQLLKIDDFAILLERISEVFAVCKDTILLNTAKEFFTGFLKNMESELKKARADTMSLNQNLLKSEEKIAKSERELGTRIKELENEINQNLRKSEEKIAKSERELGTRIKELENEINQNRQKFEEKIAKSERELADQVKRNRELSKDIESFKVREKTIRDHWLGKLVFKRLENKLT